MARAHRRARGRGLAWPLIVAAVVLALSASGALGTLPYAATLLARADWSRLFEAPERGRDVDADALRARIAALLDAGPGQADGPQTRSGFDGCLLRRETRWPAETCARDPDAVAAIVEQVDLRDLLTGPAFRTVVPANHPGGGAGAAVVLPWVPSVRRALDTAADGLAVVAAGRGPGATDVVWTGRTGGTEGTGETGGPAAGQAAGGPPGGTDTDLALGETDFGPEFARNHIRILSCSGTRLARPHGGPAAFPAQPEAADELGGLFHALGDRVCSSRGWLF